MARFALLERARRARPRLTAADLLAATATLVVACSLGILAAGGTYAYLNASAVASTSAILKAGTASLSLSAGAVNLANIYPGQTRTGVYTVTNTGDVALTLAVASITGTSAANGLVATLGAGTCSGTQTSSGPLSVPTLAKGATTTICLTVSMPTTAPVSARNLTSSVTVVVEGVQT